MPSLPPMPDLAPFLAREQFHVLVEQGHSFWVSAVASRVGTDLKGEPKPEYVYTVFCPAIMDGPGAFSLGRTAAREHQVEVIRQLIDQGTVGPCRLVKRGGENGSNAYYVIEPVEEDLFEPPTPPAAKR